ncbi:unnamed protein product [Allacma fusca]|uniref:Uncharacterized protein n=1 Tax=Allacma fusca TaxID=39272 RepID=A0A8J2PBI7_9HEXA|nr:unnamed protein product [Allacma fusca]
MINDEIKEPFVVTRKPTEVIQVSYAITAEIAEKKLKEIWESVITNDLTKNRKPRGSFPTAGECLTAGRSPMSVASDTKCDWQIKNERLTSPMDLVDCKDMREEFARMAPFDSQIENDSELDTEPDDSECT